MAAIGSRAVQDNEIAVNQHKAQTRAEQDRLSKLPVDQMTLVDIDRMESGTYIERLRREKAFGEKVNELETTRPKRPLNV